ncbi:MAG: AAA family ATPase [Pseudomonadota bacterium]
MARIIAIANQKGGVGKTTTAINLSASLATTGRRVLMVDMDPQGNATTGSGINKNDTDNTIFEVLMGEVSVADSVQEASATGYFVLPANSNLSAAEIGLLEQKNRESCLKKALRPAVNDYDFIILDCPPSLSMLTVNALTAADGVLVPMQCEYFALEGLTDLLNTVKRVTEVVNPNLKLEGILRTMYDPRSSLTKDVSKQLLDYFDEQVYQTCVPRNIRLAEAPSHGLPVLAYDKRSRGALAYLALAGEVLRQQDVVDDAPSIGGLAE